MFLRSAVRCSRAVFCRSIVFEVLSTDTKSVLGAQSHNFTRGFSVGTALSNDVNVTFLKANGEKIQTKGKVGDSLYDVVVKNKVDIVGFGACEGTLTCSTCHLILKPADYEKLPDKPADEELDMLDLACDLTDHSRLGCQITLTKEMDGLEVTVPATISDARSVD